jgi:hypothetical protein
LRRITSDIGIIFEEVLNSTRQVWPLMSTGLWVTYADFSIAAAWPVTVLSQLKEQLVEVRISVSLFLAASTIVEVVDAHQGFKVVTSRITTTKSGLFWTIDFLHSFFRDPEQSTVTIVMSRFYASSFLTTTIALCYGGRCSECQCLTPIEMSLPPCCGSTTSSHCSHYSRTFLPSFVCLVALAFLVRQVKEDETQSRCLKSLLCHLEANWSFGLELHAFGTCLAEFTVSATMLYCTTNALLCSLVMKSSPHRLIFTAASIPCHAYRSRCHVTSLILFTHEEERGTQGPCRSFQASTDIGYSFLPWYFDEVVSSDKSGL